MTLSTVLDSIRDIMPDLRAAALVLLPEGIVLDTYGGSEIENEPLARACRRCFGEGAGTLDLCLEDPLSMREYLLLYEDGTYVFERGRREPRLALAASFGTNVNPSLLLSCARSAMEHAENAVDIAALES